jgi:hypothetical protein
MLSMSCLPSPVSPRIIPATESAVDSFPLLLSRAENIQRFYTLSSNRCRTSSEPVLCHRGIPSLPANAQDYIPLFTETQGDIPVYLWLETLQGILGFLDPKSEQYDSVLPYFRQSTATAKEVWVPRNWDAIAFPKQLTTRRPCRLREQPVDLPTPPSTPETISSTQGQRPQDSERRAQEDGARAMVLRVHPSSTFILKNPTSSDPHMLRSPQIRKEQVQRRCLQESEQETMEPSNTNASTIASGTLTVSTPSISSNRQVQREPLVNGSAQRNEFIGVAMMDNPLLEATSGDSRRGPAELGVDQTVIAGATGSFQGSGIHFAADLSCSTDTSATFQEPQHFSITQAFDHRWERLYQRFVGTYPSKGRPRTLEPGQMIKIPGLGVLWNRGVREPAHGTRFRSGVSSVPFRIDGGSPWSPVAGLNLTARFPWEARLALIPAAKSQHGNHPTNMRNNVWKQGIQSPPAAQPNNGSSSSIRTGHIEPSSSQPDHTWSTVVAQRLEWTPPVQQGNVAATSVGSHNSELPLRYTWAQPVELSSGIDQCHGPKGANGYQFQDKLNSKSPARPGRCVTMPTCMSRPRSVTASRDVVTPPTVLQGVIDTEASYTSANAFQFGLTVPRRTNMPIRSMTPKMVTSPKRASSSEIKFTATRRSCGSVHGPNDLVTTTGQSDAEPLVPSSPTNPKELKEEQGSIMEGDGIAEESGATTSRIQLPAQRTESFASVDGESETFTEAATEVSEAPISLSEATETDMGSTAIDRKASIAGIESTDELKGALFFVPDVPAVGRELAIGDSERPITTVERRVTEVDIAATYIAPPITYANVVATFIGPHITDTETLMACSEPGSEGNEAERGRGRLRGRRKWRALTDSDY